MSKLAPYIGGALLAIFAIAVAGVVVSLSYQALGMIFPDNLANQLIGLVLFDFASLCWFIAFVYMSESTMQYVWSLLGFLAGLIGTISLVAIEVGVSSGFLDKADMVKPLTYTFIIAAVTHLVLVYLRHAAAPKVTSRISLGIEKAKITNEGMRQAEQYLEISRAQLGSTINHRLVGEVLRDLNMDRIIDLPALPVDDSLYIPSMPANDSAGNLFERAKVGLDNIFQKKSHPDTNPDMTDNNGQIVWTETPDGKRRRVFCLICRSQGKDWLSQEPCSHVLKAVGTPTTVLKTDPEERFENKPLPLNQKGYAVHHDDSPAYVPESWEKGESHYPKAVG